jgi:hypothetical protein
MRKISLLILLVTLSKTTLGFIDTTGLQVSLAGDMIYDQGLNSTSTADEKLTMRGVEMTFYAPLDHRFDGVISAAAHDENGETIFELHELYLGSTKLIPRSRFRVGQFFLGIGRLNRFHQHDWPFIRAPKVHEEFFDSEGVIDKGAEYGYLLPTEFYLDLTLGLTSGHTYGHSHTVGSKPKVPTHYTRLATFKEFNSTDGLLFSLNYLGRTDEQDNAMSLYGTELVAKWREGKRLKYLLQSEAWFRSTKSPGQNNSEQVGLYVFNQYGFTSSTLLGLRLDGYKDLSKLNSITQKKINNVEYGSSLELTWKSSEFVTIRTAASHTFLREEGDTITKDTRLEAQFVFIMGAHPAHSF